MGVILKYPASTACRAARISKQRFNEAVAAKKYRCAPQVKKGGTRSFTENDIVALFIYARLVEQDMGPRVAGEIACALREQLERQPAAAEIRLPRLVEDSKLPANGELESNSSEMIHEVVHMHMVFDVAGVRKEITCALKEILKET